MNVILLILTVIVATEGLTIQIPKKSTRKCNFNRDVFWNVFGDYVKKITHVTIVIISSPKSSHDIKKYTEHFLKIAAKEKVLPVKIKELEIDTTTRKFVTFKYDNPEVLEGNISDLARSMHEWKNILKYTKEWSHINVIMVWDTVELYYFLRQDLALIMENPRAAYVVFIFTEESCSETLTNMIKILEAFWHHHRILNVITNTPCSCNSGDILIYKPFVFHNGTQGVVQKFSLEDLQFRFYSILNILDNMHGYPIRASIFLRDPTAIRSQLPLLRNNPIYQRLRGLHGLAGIDPYVMANIAEVMNFSIKLIEAKAFGYQVADGVYFGSLGDIVDRRADVLVNSRFLQDYRTDRIEYSAVLNRDRLCLAARKAPKIPKWIMLYRCFAFSTWLCILTVFLLSILLPKLFYQISPNKQSTVDWLTIVAIFCSVSRRFERISSQGIYLVSVLIFTVILCGIFDGTLVTSFTTLASYKDLNTLKDVDDAGLKIVSDELVFHGTASPLMQSLYNKVIFTNDTPLRKFDLSGRYAFVMRKSESHWMTGANFIDGDGEPLIHVLEECSRVYFLCLLFPKGSPFLNRFNHVIRLFFEGGFTYKWNKDVIDSYVIAAKAKKVIRPQKRAFTLNDIQSAFIMWFIGIVLCILVFLCEVIYFKYTI